MTKRDMYVDHFYVFQMRFSELLPGRWNSTEHKSVRDSFHHGLKRHLASGHTIKVPWEQKRDHFSAGSQAEPAQRSGLCHHALRPQPRGLKRAPPGASAPQTRGGPEPPDRDAVSRDATPPGSGGGGQGATIQVIWSR